MIQFSRADIVKNYKNISSIECAVEIETGVPTVRPTVN